MPSYTFENKDTEEIMEMICSYEEAKAIEAYGEYRLLPSAPMIVSGRGHVHSKIDDGFNEVLTEMKSKHPNSTINTK